MNFTQDILAKQSVQLVDYGNRIQNLENDLFKQDLEFRIMQESH
jgi:hypothetical protein